MPGSYGKLVGYAIAWTFLLVLTRPDAARSEQLPIKTFTTADGLVSNRISRIARDQRGFLWFCTEGGLSRFDGYTFTNYTTQQGMASNWVDDFIETGSGVFLVGTEAGLCVFDPRGEPPQGQPVDLCGRRPVFSLFRPEADDPSVKVLYEDSLGNVWCGTTAGVYRLEVVDGQVMFHRLALDPAGTGPRPRRVKSIVEGGAGLLWILTDEELFRYAIGGDVERVEIGKEFTAAALMHLVTSPDGLLRVSTRAGMWVINPNAAAARRARRYAAEAGLACLEMTALYQDDGGQLWAGTDYGLYEFVKGEDRFRLRLGVTDIRDARVWSFCEDRFGNLWVGTANGAIRLARDGFTTFTEADGIGFREVYHIAEAKPGEIHLYTRFGVTNSFIDIFDGERFVSRKIASGPSSTLWINYYQKHIPIRDRQGEWWWPTWKGLYRYRNLGRMEAFLDARPVARYTTKDGLPADILGAAYADRRDDIWVSTFAGAKSFLARWERATGRFHVYSQADGFPEGRFPSTFCEDQDGNLWVGFRQGGLLRYRDGRFTLFDAAAGVPAGEIKQVYPDSRGRVWIASSNGGLGRVDNVSDERPTIATYTVNDGLASDSILCVAEDRADRFYVATNRGLNLIDFTTGGVKRFTTTDGLANDQVDAIFRDSRGDFWFGTVTGVSRLSPGGERAQQAPPIYINGLTIAGHVRRTSEVGETAIGGLTLAPGEGQIGIRFGSLFFGAGDLIRYQYQLEGADADWQPPTTQRDVNYANLGAGRYRFLVRAINSDGAMSESPAAVEFAILPPLYLRWWFLALAALTLFALSYLAYWYRLSRLIEMERVRTRIATDLHDDIGSSLSQIAILSEVIRREVRQDNLRVHKPLTTIATTSRELVDSMSDIVWAINPRRDHLSDLSRRMREFAGDILTARNIDFDFAAPEREKRVRIDTDTRREVFLIFKEAVNNLARHSGCSRAVMEFIAEEGRIDLRVSDNGRGFDAGEDGDGHGLASMRRRAKLIDGEVRIVSEAGKGTSVRLRAPIRPRRRFWKSYPPE